MGGGDSSWSAAVVVAAASGTINGLHTAAGANTPEYLTECALGAGTNAASFSGVPGVEKRRAWRHCAKDVSGGRARVRPEGLRAVRQRQAGAHNSGSNVPNVCGRHYSTQRLHGG